MCIPNKNSRDDTLNPLLRGSFCWILRTHDPIVLRPRLVIPQFSNQIDTAVCMTMLMPQLAVICSKISTNGNFFIEIFCRSAVASIPLKSTMHIEFSPYFHKIYKFVPSYFDKMLKSPYFHSIYGFCFPYFDNDAFMLYTYWMPLHKWKVKIKFNLKWNEKEEWMDIFWQEWNYFWSRNNFFNGNFKGWNGNRIAVKIILKMVMRLNPIRVHVANWSRTIHAVIFFIFLCTFWILYSTLNQ